MLARISLIGALALGACSPSAQPAPSAGELERFTNEIARQDGERKREAIDDADARAAARAEKATERIADSELRRRRGEVAAGDR